MTLLLFLFFYITIVIVIKKNVVLQRGGGGWWWANKNKKIRKLESAEVEKDVGVIVDLSLSGSSQCAIAVKKKKANRMLGYIARSIEYKSKEVILTLYNTTLGVLCAVLGTAI